MFQQVFHPRSPGEVSPGTFHHKALPTTKPCSSASNRMRTDSGFSRFGGMEPYFKLKYLLKNCPRYCDSIHREVGVMVAWGKGRKEKKKGKKEKESPCSTLEHKVLVVELKEL